MKNNRQIIVDTETTGLYANNGDRIIEFAGLEMVDRVLNGRSLHLYINPECDISEEAIKVHGITLSKLIDKPIFAQVAQQIHNFIKGSNMIIHNAPFDISFLNMEFEKVGLDSVENISTVTDSLKMARDLYPGQKNSLDALCTRLSVDRSKRVLHGALIDCELLARVYLSMTHNQFELDINNTASQTYFHEQKTNLYETVNRKQCIIEPTQEELAAHQLYCEAIDKESGGNCTYLKKPND